jgi:hypothetical protein
VVVVERAAAAVAVFGAAGGGGGGGGGGGAAVAKNAMIDSGIAGIVFVTRSSGTTTTRMTTTTCTAIEASLDPTERWRRGRSLFPVIKSNMASSLGLFKRQVTCRSHGIRNSLNTRRFQLGARPERCGQLPGQWGLLRNVDG